MHASDTDDRTPRVRPRFARLLAVLAIALTLIAIPASMPDVAAAKRTSEHVAMRQCLAAGGKISWDFYTDGTADMICTLPSRMKIYCVPIPGPFSGIVDCF